MEDIKNLTFEELEIAMERIGESSYRAAQVFSWLYRKGGTHFQSFTDLSRNLRDRLDGLYSIGRLELHGQFQSLDKTEKFVFRLEDGNFIETVLIPSGRRKTLCLSTQVGCKFACAFCASGLNGFTRNLTPSEIVNQALYSQQHFDDHLTNLVFMGMGEPLDNLTNLVKAIRIFNSPRGMGIAARRMTVSTCGLIHGIERFQNLGLQVNLSLSLHAVTDRLRNQLMPVNRKNPLEKLILACRKYCEVRGRKMTLEYILIQGVNDSSRDAESLVRIAKRLKAKVNLIPYSPVVGLEFRVPPEEKMAVFRSHLEDHKVNVTRRRSKGKDILAACGQLAGRVRA
ncbi:MAG: 23S rRNA (adenine(2503)-C(2))-methyltransferase RlmN [Candidatus Aminicenantales bacterium]